MRIFLGALLCYVISSIKDVDPETYISKIIEIIEKPKNLQSKERKLIKPKEP